MSMSLYKKDKYINNIISGLGRVQNELNMHNATNHYDINIISEDFFAGLLNLIYGYNLKNANHEKKNTEAIDLFDEKNRIAVQVTYNNDSRKLQETIDKYIKCELYADYKCLIFLLLQNKKSYEKKFDTKGLFCFDKKRDIMDINDLTAKIKTLDTEILMKIDNYFAVEIDGYRQSDKKKKIIPIIVAAVMIMSSLIGYNILRHSRIANVYASNIYPYNNAGIYISCEDLPTLYKTEIETDKAFAIMSNIRNFGEKTSSVEQQYCEILNLEPIEEAIVILDAVIIDNTLYLFAFNNGWGNTNSPVIKNAALTSQNIDKNLEEFSESVDYAESTEIKSSGGVLIAKYVLNSELLEHYYGEHGLQFLNLHIQAEGIDYDVDFAAYLDLTENGFCLKYDDKGGYNPTISLFAVLDVDQKPSAVYFTGKNAIPSVEDILNIETVLAPTKSCVVECRNVFSVNGKRQQTDVYTAKVKVPVFNDTAISCSGELTHELAHMQQIDEMSIDRVVQKYLYKPESIIENADDN